jgi:hypothetical protein
MKKHFVIFFSPGAIVSEKTKKDIDCWDVGKAVQMARSIKERHGATPYGFQFTTRERMDNELDSKEVDRSGTYFLGGEVLTLEDIKKRNDPKDSILISNMEVNGWDRVIENNNSWKITQPMKTIDKVVSFKELKK